MNRYQKTAEYLEKAMRKEELEETDLGDDSDEE